MLVSNLGQQRTINLSPRDETRTQAFTTAAAPGSVFVLESIEMGIFHLDDPVSDAHLSNLRVQLWSPQSNGAPGSKIADLTIPQSAKTDGVKTFAAPAGTRLEGNTTYHVVVFSTGSIGGLNFNLYSTVSDEEDTASLGGWSIADDSFVAATGNAEPTASSGWGTEFRSVRIRVNGSLDPATRGSVTLSANPNPVAAGGLVTFTMLASHGAFPENLYLNIAEGIGSAWWDTSPTFPGPATTNLNLSPRPSETQMTAPLRIRSLVGDETIVINLHRSDGGLQEGPLTIRVLGSGSGGSPSAGGGGGSGGGGGISAPTPTPPTQPPPPTPPTEQPAPPRCGENDRENLVRLYDATDGDNWNDNTDWKSEEPLQEWFGVDTDEDGEVVSLRLADNGLSGDMPTKELLCLDENTELKELALWDNEDLSGDVPEELVRAVERAVLREIAETLDLNPGWFDDYEDPFDFEDWHEGVTTDEDGRVTELALPGEIPRNLSGQLKKLREIAITTSSSGGGCAVGASSGRVGASGLLVAVFMLLAVSRGLRACS